MAVPTTAPPGSPSTSKASSPAATPSRSPPSSLTRRAAGCAGGEIDDGSQTTLTLWHSDDGRALGGRSRVEGLDHTDTEEDGESIESLAVVDDMMLVVREATGLDDSRLSLLRGTLGQFEELEPTGLDALDLPNSDVIPAVTAVDDQFVLFASVPIEGGDDFGERIPTLFTSPDGETWAASELDGPILLDPFSLQALTATDDRRDRPDRRRRGARRVEVHR